MDRKNIIIGLDGATWEIIDYFIGENIMPNFRNLKEKVCYGKLKSTILPITPSAWASMMTGCSPPKTGIFHFLKFSGKNNAYSKTLVNGDDINVPTMWQVLSNYERDVISINVPMTFPPKPVNGIIISGMMTPKGEKNFTFPENLSAELKENGISYRVDTYLRDNQEKLQDGGFVKKIFNNGAEDFFKDLNELLDIRKKTIRYLMENKKWQYFMFVIIGMDRIQHYFWEYIKNPELDIKISENIKAYYKKVDKFVGELCSEFQSIGNIFIVSDHGFAKLHGNFIIDGWLLKKGYLKNKDKRISNWKTVIKKFLKKYGVNVKKIAETFLDEEKAKKLKLSASNIDWQHTLAYGTANGINLNLKGREAIGCVEPARYDEIRERIIYDLKNITNSQGIKIIKNSLKKEEVYDEGDLDSIPDIILEFDDELLYGTVPSEYVREDMDLFETYDWLSGNHIRDGVFMALGKDIKENGRLLEEINIEDIFPTLLALNDEKIPRHLDGKIIKNIINREIKEDYISFKYAAKDEKYQYSKSGEEDLKEKLKSLGYM